MAIKKVPPRYKPVGQVTRGKTAHNRLRRTDIFLLLTEHELLSRQDTPCHRSLYVDLGYGAEAFTTLESAARFRTVNPNLGVLGVEIEPERVNAGLPYQDDKTYFRLGGFNVPLLSGESIRLMRAFNVLRQYDESEFFEAILRINSQLISGGLLLEGTSNPYGSIWTANLFRNHRGECLHEGFLFSTNFHMGFEPGMFQPYLTKNYIHHMIPGELIFDFFESWKGVCRDTQAFRSFGIRQWFTESARALARHGYRIDLRPQLLKRGFLLWRGDSTGFPTQQFTA